MSQQSAAVSAGGVVRVGEGESARDLVVVAKLSIAHENLLRKELAEIARNAMGPGGFFARMKPALEWMKSAGMHSEWAEAIKTTTEMQGRGVEPDYSAIEQARQTVPGVVAELHWRTRLTCPEVTKQEIAAVVTEVNAADLYGQIVRAITDDGKSD